MLIVLYCNDLKQSDTRDMIVRNKRQFGRTHLTDEIE